MDAFSLTKWYLDVTDDRGRLAIAYWTRVAWGPLALGWEGLSRYDGTGTAVHRSALAAGGEPAWSNGVLGWHSTGLACSMKCEPWNRPFESVLLETPGGSIEWSCQVPGATVTFDPGDGSPIRGAGYAERIVLTLVPWRLPIAELRWGRWLSPRTRRSLAWIDWRGAHPLTLVLDCGRLSRPAIVGDASIAFGEGEAGAPGAVLRLDRPVTLYTRALSDVLRGLRPLTSRLPAPWLAVEDHKTRSFGTLDSARHQAETGWAIHEVVRLPGRVSP